MEKDLTEVKVDKVDKPQKKDALQKEIEETTVEPQAKVPTRKTTPVPMSIGSMAELKNYIEAAQVVKKSKQAVMPDIEVGFMADFFINMTHKTDERTSTYPMLEKQLKEVKAKNPEKFEAFTAYVLELAKLHDGDISAKARKEKKLDIIKNNSSSSSTSPLPTIPTVARISPRTKGQDFSPEKALSDYEEVAQLKEEMRKITLEATQKTIEMTKGTAVRNAILGAVGTGAATLIAGLASYYGSGKTPSSACPTCPTLPPPAPPF
jgi:hypothetical protein